jgi:hypothetical protein
MTLKRLALLFCLLFAVFPTFAQQPVATTRVTKDSQAVTLLNQVLASAGGVSALLAVQDFTGAGTITYSQPQGVTGTVVVRGTQLEQYRMDATISSGVRSQSMSNGQLTLKREDGTAVPLSVQVPLCPECVIFPYLVLAPALTSPQLSLSYKGAVQLDGNSVQQIEIQEVVTGLGDANVSEYHTIDFFVDPSTFQILMLQDVIPNHLVRQIRFTNYQSANGVLVPFTIAEQSGGLPTWTIQLSQITFNTGLQASDFQL